MRFEQTPNLTNYNVRLKWRNYYFKLKDKVIFFSYGQRTRFFF